MDVLRSWLMVVTESGGEGLALLAVGCVLLLSAVLAYLLDRTGIFIALSAVVSGLFRMALLFGKQEERRAIFWQGLLLLCTGVLYLSLQIALMIRNNIRMRKEARAEIERRIAYTLPERENTYVRSRLNTTLYVPGKEVNADMGTAQGTQEPIKLDYARTLLNRLREAPLSGTERLQIEDLGKMLSIYLSKKKWTAKDARAVNDLCATLLKLSGKYNV